MKTARGILEVARKAGVSSATVSRVLSGNAFVSDETKAKVLKAVQDLKFQPNQMAQSLRTGRSKTVALLVGDIEQGIYPALTRHIQEALEENGYEALLYNLGHRHKRLEMVLERAQALRLGGVILATSDPLDPAKLDPLFTQLRERGAFALAVGQSLHRQRVPSIIYDEQAAVETSVDYLFRRYGGKVGFIGRIADSVLGAQRFEGYRAALQRNGIAFDAKIVCDTAKLPGGRYRFDAGKDSYRALCANSVRAIQASSDELALGAISAILDSGLRVPEDIAVAGVGDVAWSAHVTPALTTLGCHTQRVAQKLIELIQGFATGEELPSCIVFERPFILRASA